MQEEKYTIAKDIKVFCVKADSFPEDIQKSHETLAGMIPTVKHRKFYGISYPVNGKIMYMTGVEETESGQAEKFVKEKNCVPFTIRAGTYISKVVKDYQRNIPEITKVFDVFLKRPEVDQNGYCLEEYYEDDPDLRCSVPLKH